MGEVLDEKCGIVGSHDLVDAIDMLDALRHRGQDMAGIGAIRRSGLVDVIRWPGSPTKFRFETLQGIFTRSLPPGDEHYFYFGHVRYATRGDPSLGLDEGHPFTIGGTVEIKGSVAEPNHVIVRGADAAVVHNGQVGDLGYDPATLETRVDTEQLLRYFHERGPEEVLRKVPLAYTAIFADAAHGGITVLRDRTGIKPGALGTKDRLPVFASEDLAFRKNHVTKLGDIEPGAVYTVGPDGPRLKRRIVEPERALCFFEINYIANPDSVVDRISVGDARVALGRALAREFAPSDVDLVTFMPSAPHAAAAAYADELGLRFEEVLYKPERRRSFLEPNQASRERSIAGNLYVESGIDLEGKTIVIVDDSIVRGTNSKRLVAMLATTGVKKAYLASYTPPIGIYGDDSEARGCEYGVDMPPSTRFVARDDENGRNRTPEEISSELGIETYFLSRDGMIRVLGRDPGSLCTFCIGGPRPYPVVASNPERT